MLLAAPLGEAPRDVAGRLSSRAGGRAGRRLRRPDRGRRVPASSTSSSPTTGTGRRWPVSPRRERAWGRRRPSRRSGSWSSSSPPTRPARCTSAAAATRPTATPWRACSRRSGTRCSASTTSTTRVGRCERFAASIAAQMTGGEPPEDGYEGAYVTELAERLRGRGGRSGRRRRARPSRGRAGARAGARHARALRRRLRQLVLRARPATRRARSRRRSRRARAARPHLQERGRAVAAQQRVRRRQGPCAGSRRRRSRPTSPPTSPTTATSWSAASSG